MGRAWEKISGLPYNTKKLMILAPYPDKVGAEWLAPTSNPNVYRFRVWKDLISNLENDYGQTVKVSVIPDATIQYFPEAVSFWKTLNN